MTTDRKVALKAVMMVVSRAVQTVELMGAIMAENLAVSKAGAMVARLGFEKVSKLADHWVASLDGKSVVRLAESLDGLMAASLAEKTASHSAVDSVAMLAVKMGV